MPAPASPGHEKDQEDEPGERVPVKIVFDQEAIRELRDKIVTRLHPAMRAAFFLVFVPAACTVGPNYQGPPPQTDLPAKFKGVSAGTGKFRPALPNDVAAGGPWWRAFGDPGLNRLEEQGVAGNPDLAQAVQRIAQARAQTRLAAVDLYPTLTGDPSFVRQRSTSTGAEQRARITGSTSALSGGGSAASSSGPSPEYTGSNGPLLTEQPKSSTFYDFRVPIDLSWELDLFGRVRRNLEAARAQGEAAEADLQATRLSVTANIAVNYFTLRALDAEEEVLRRTIKTRRDGLHIAEERLAAGLSGELDVQRSRSDLASNEADLYAVQRSRAETENAIATLMGIPASNLRLPYLALRQAPPRIPPGLPSRLLERRPDVASAERALAAANAQVGVATAAFFPDVRLNGLAGFETANIGDIVAAQSLIWSLGPSITIPIFEGGRNRANLELARASYLGSVARYRAQVLIAFQDVENALADLHNLAGQAEAQDLAISAARRSLELSQQQYDKGAVTFLDVLDAERTLLADERSAAQILGARLQATVQLVKALGGQWR